MECNKDKAKKAMDMAKKKLSENDYDGAKGSINKAEILYPKLDGLKQVLTMINVYIAAASKINNGERDTDWYGVLGVDPSADDEAMKKEYKKLALLLHPDTNKCNGAEGAFKLVSEAWCLLSDKIKINAYDQKGRSKEANTQMQKPPNPNGNANAGVDPSGGAESDQPASGTQEPPNPHKKAKHGASENAGSNKQASAVTFWTMCNGCKTRGEYMRDSDLDKAILCPNCCQIFIATEKSP